jgi:hypothetical protein
VSGLVLGGDALYDTSNVVVGDLVQRLLPMKMSAQGPFDLVFRAGLPAIEAKELVEGLGKGWGSVGGVR